MSLWRLYYHIVWATKERQPFITATIEPELHGYIAGKVQAMNALLHAIGGVEDHVHLVVSIPPKISVMEFVRNVKGSSAHHLNLDITNPVTQFGWQRGYGIFSLGGKQLPEAVAYVKNQKTHHQQGTLMKMLEQTSDEPASKFAG